MVWIIFILLYTINMTNLPQWIEKKESMKGWNWLKSTFFALMVAAWLFNACSEGWKDTITSSSIKETNVTAPFLDGPTWSARGIGDTTDTDSKQYSPIQGLSVPEAAHKLAKDGLYFREEWQSDEEFVQSYKDAVETAMVER